MLVELCQRTTNFHRQRSLGFGEVKILPDGLYGSKPWRVTCRPRSLTMKAVGLGSRWYPDSDLGLYPAVLDIECTPSSLRVLVLCRLTLHYLIVLFNHPAGGRSTAGTRADGGTEATKRGAGRAGKEYCKL